MSTCRKLLPLGAVALAFAVAPANAAPTASATAAIAPKLENSDSHASAVVGRPPRYGYGYRRGWGPGPWLGLGAGVVVGSIIANEAYRPRPGYYYDDYAYNGPYYYPSAYSGDPRRSAPRTSARSSGIRACTRPIPARSGSAPT